VTIQTSEIDSNHSATDDDPTLGQSDRLILPTEAGRELGECHGPLGSLGRPFDRRNPFFVGLTGAFGVVVAYVVFRCIADIASVLVIVGLALFIAIGLNPVIELLIARSLSRGAAVAIVTFGFVLVVAAFLVVAVPPITHESHVLLTNYPRYKADLVAKKPNVASRKASEVSVQACVRVSAASKAFSGSSGAAPRRPVSIIMLSFMFGVQDREGLSDGMSLPRMIKPLLEGFDPARSPLLF